MGVEVRDSQENLRLPADLWYNCSERIFLLPMKKYINKVRNPWPTPPSPWAPRLPPGERLIVWRKRRISKVTVSPQHPLQTHLRRPAGLLPSYLALQKSSEASWAKRGDHFTTHTDCVTKRERRRSVSSCFPLTRVLNETHTGWRSRGLINVIIRCQIISLEESLPSWTTLKNVYHANVSATWSTIILSLWATVLSY